MIASAMLFLFTLTGCVASCNTWKRSAACIVSAVVLQVCEAQVEYTCFQALQQQEVLAAPDRIERMKLLVAGQRQREAELQQRYKQLCQQRDDMREQLAGMGQGQHAGTSKLASTAAAAGAMQVPATAS